jgi:hypothetical protein
MLNYLDQAALLQSAANTFGLSSLEPCMRLGQQRVEMTCPPSLGQVPVGQVPLLDDERLTQLLHTLNVACRVPACNVKWGEEQAIMCVKRGCRPCGRGIICMECGSHPSSTSLIAIAGFHKIRAHVGAGLWPLACISSGLLLLFIP